MKPKLSEQASRLAQVKRGLDQISSGSFSTLPKADDGEIGILFEAFNEMAEAVKSREDSLRNQNVQLAASVSRIETLLDASIDGIAFVGQDVSFQFVNRRFCEILGLRPGDLNKKNAADIEELLLQSVANPQRLMRVFTPPPHDNVDGTLDVVDDVIELSGQETRYAQAYSAPVLDDDDVYAGRIISLHDNTREMELDRLKTEFISVVSHELRTPLTSIKGYTDLLITEAAGEINDIQREFLGILQSSANRLGNLINDILDLSRIDAGRMEVKHVPVDYVKIVGDLARLMKAAADEKEISLDVSFPQDMPMVIGDHDKIIQVVSNLLSNAVKYTPEGGWIKILVEVTGESTIRTCIADSGIGISLPDQKKLFQKFFRADNSLTREAGGTGLGLVIVKSIVELLGGAIWVHSEAGRGSKFYYTLPLYAGRSLSGADGRNEETHIIGAVPDRGLALILVVDGSSSVRETVQHALHRRGYGIAVAGSLDDARHKARLHKPDLILLDVMMDRCQGFSILTALSADPATASLPVLALSLDTDSKGEKITLGAISFTGVPPELSTLISTLSEREALLVQAQTVLIVTFEPRYDPTAAASSVVLRQAGIESTIVQGAAAAITSIVARIPDAMLIIAENIEDPELHGFLSAIKSENDFARIPAIIATNTILSDDIFFHLGDANPDVKAAPDYIAEQVAAILRVNSYRLVVPNSNDDGAESGILNDNR